MTHVWLGSFQIGLAILFQVFCFDKLFWSHFSCKQYSSKLNRISHLQVSTLSSQIIKFYSNPLQVRRSLFANSFTSIPIYLFTELPPSQRVRKNRGLPSSYQNTIYNYLGSILYPGRNGSNRTTYKKNDVPSTKSRIKTGSRCCFHEA
jgi:hypothetical protein